MTTALITGGNRGIGYAVAQLLGQQGMSVVITSRDLTAGEQAAAALKAADVAADVVVLDVTDAGSVSAAAAEVEKRIATLDVLVNNAGILPEATNAAPREVVDLEMFRRTYQTNVFGPVAVLEAFLPLLRRSAAPRIVNVTTTMGSLTDQTDPSSPYYSTVVPAYQSSKAALNSVTIALAKLLAETPAKVTSVCPGFVRTDLTPMNRDSAPLSAEDAATVIARAATLPADAPTGSFIDANGNVPW